MTRLRRLFARADTPPIVPTTGWTAALTTLAATAMSFLAVLTLAAGIAANRLAADWRADLAGAATVRVSAPGEVRPARVETALEILRTTPGIAAARPLSDEEHVALLSPWLGEGVRYADLPAPRLIAVTLEGAGPDAEQLQARLDRDAPGAYYDDHQAWRGPLAEMARALEGLAWAAIGLIALTAAGMVAIAARATLAANHEIVRVIRLIGAEDSFITRAFVGRLAMRGLAGGLIGTALGVLGLRAMPGASGADGLAVSLTPGLLGWMAILIGVPLASAAIAWLTAALSVNLTLKRMM